MRILSFILLVILLHPDKAFCQVKYDVYISNSGSDKNIGNTPSSPRQTIHGSDTLFKRLFNANKSVSVGIRSGDVFNESLTPSYPIQLSTYFDTAGKNNFAILNGSDEFNSEWMKEPGLLNTYRQAVPSGDFFQQPIGGYSYMYVIEIDKELEKTAPITARKPMTFVSTLTALDTIPGSFYEPLLTRADTLSLIYIHASNSSSPNLNKKYRYEVSVRNSGMYVYPYNNNRFENLWVRGYGTGYGLLPSGINTYCGNIIFGPGTAIHHIVLKNGVINNSLFLRASKNVNLYAVVFYIAQGIRQPNFIKNSIFLDILYPIYSHTSFPASYASLHLDSVIAFADSTIGGLFLTTSNNDSTILNNIYVDNYTNGYNNYDAFFNSISNAVFKDVSSGIKYSPTHVNSIVENNFIKTHASGITMAGNDTLRLSSSIIHLYTTVANKGHETFIDNRGNTINHINAIGNIFINDAYNNQKVLMAVANTNNGIGTTSDRWSNNVYIELNGSKINWSVTNATTNAGSATVNTFSEWQKQSGQDKNSLFFDLSNDPRGLKAIFIDPDNGDYELANTTEANQIRAIHAGMTNPITCFLQKPTYEQAAALIMEHKALLINSCRNPCLFNTIRVNYKFTSSLLNHKQVELLWNIAEQQNIDHYEIEKSTDNLNFTSVGTSAVSQDSTYTFTDNKLQLNATCYYRLAIVAKNGYKCYSSVDSIKVVSNKHQLIIYPNPSTGRILVTMNGYTGAAYAILTNAIGQTIATKKITLQNGSSQIFDLTNKSKGIYSIKLQTLDGVYIERFVLE